MVRFSSFASARLLTFTLASSLVSVLAQTELGFNWQGCVTEGEFEAGTDFFPSKYTAPSIFTYNLDTDVFGNTFEPHNTTDLLEITYHKTYKIVNNKFHNQTYLLYQCGTEPPAEELEGNKHSLVLSVPHKGGLILTETTQIPLVELLGLRTEIVGYFGSTSFISSPCIKHLVDTEEIEAIPRYFNASDVDSLEEFLSRNPDAILVEGPFDSATTTDRSVGVAASQERTNVATFDWLAFYAAFYNLEGVSERISSETQARYDCSSTNAAALQTQRKEQEVETKTILWAVFFAGSGWSLGDCPTWDAAFFCEYATHCGATILNRPEGVGTNQTFGSFVAWYVNDEELLEIGKDADIFVYTGFDYEQLYATKNATFDQIKAVQNNEVYDPQGQGGSAWFEQRLAEYDVVGLDFCDIVGNNNPELQHTRRWLRHIDEPIGSLGECNVPDELTQPFVPLGAECSLLVTDDSSDSSALAMANVFAILGLFFVCLTL